MSREPASSRNASQNGAKHLHSEATENEFDNSSSSIHFPLPRTPLNSIPDPSQYQRGFLETDFDSKEKVEAIMLAESLEKINRIDGLYKTGILGSTHGTPRVFGRGGKAQPEPSSAQSTPGRSGSRVSLGGSMTGPRIAQSTGGRGVSSSSRIPRAISVASSENCVEVPHFELDENPSFWTDHNVQVLIRIRPLNTMERLSKGHGRCLRQESAQTLTWLGHPETRFTFDLIAGETESQENLFKVTGRAMVENCLSGYNSCMFAYGQTGSGKTYTMMGEIFELEGELNEDCGITPRIFEYLFTRIRTEEESRRDEKLKFSCKCSFLEIYNEQITDLLEPSSTSLQLREDLKKGVYVENLTEYDVRTVSDVVKLLLQGAANRKMAATNMNSESSRSHSVFTCIIESRWEKDSMTHFRFARLNLVDLAGSERQKSSGAEGDRLKEAANINKSLSTLGLVIMSLVDLAHGKQRHIPYRDSRLTFLLQDSLGGNSKTMILANISPSICSANETVSTLKFAQRAKLIQNNAKVNEDASGDVTALQRQIQQLKGQLSSLMTHHNFLRSPSSSTLGAEESRLSRDTEEPDFSAKRMLDASEVQNYEKMRCLEGILVGALRREKMAETAVQRLEAEIEHMNHLACQREEDVQRNKLMLRFREDRIKQLEMVVNGSISADKYLIEENKVLKEELHQLQARIDKKPELTHFALDNIRLLEQLQLFRNFYEQGERETLLAEVAGLRDQLRRSLEENNRFWPGCENPNNDAVKELEVHKSIDSRLMRKEDISQLEHRNYLHCQAAFDSVTSSFTRSPDEFSQADKYSLVQSMSIRSDIGVEMASFIQANDENVRLKGSQNMRDALVMQPSDSVKELRDGRLLMGAIASEQVHGMKELQLIQEHNLTPVEVLTSKDNAEMQYKFKLESQCMQLNGSNMEKEDIVMVGSDNFDRTILQAKLDELAKQLDGARLLNGQYQEEHASQRSVQHQLDLVREQVEMEATTTILHLQEEIDVLQMELQKRLCSMSEENIRLRNTIVSKEEEIKSLCTKWEKATLELTSFLLDGSRSLKDASYQIESIAYSFPQVNLHISEHVERAARVCVEKEETLSLLQRSLEDAQKMVLEMELKLSSLKGITISFNEFQQQDDNDGNIDVGIQLDLLLNEKINTIKMLEDELKFKDDKLAEAEKRAGGAILLAKWLTDSHQVSQKNNTGTNFQCLESPTPLEISNCAISDMNAEVNALTRDDFMVHIELARFGLSEYNNAINAAYGDVELHLKALQKDHLHAYSGYRETIQHLVEEIHEMRCKFGRLKENGHNFPLCTVNSQSSEADRFATLGNPSQILLEMKNELAVTNDRLCVINDCIRNRVRQYAWPSKEEDLTEADGWGSDSSLSDSDFATESVAIGNNMIALNEPMVDMQPLEGSLSESCDREPKKLKKPLEQSTDAKTMKFCLREELEIAFNAFKKLYIRLTTILNEKGIEDGSFTEDMKLVVPSFGMYLEIADAGCHDTSEAVADEKISHVSSFFSKFEETHASLKEADFMLNALLKANEDAKRLSGLWMQAGEDLMVERTSLIEEVERLNSSIHLTEQESKLLQEEIHYSLVDVADAMSFLEESFNQMKRELGGWFESVFSGVLSVGREMLYFISSVRCSLEDMCSELMEKDFSLFVLYQCHIGELIRKISNLNHKTGFHPFIWQGCHLVKSKFQDGSMKNQAGTIGSHERGGEEGDPSDLVVDLEKEDLELSHDELICANLLLKKELKRKEILLQGLLFDFALLQESVSAKKDIKDETEQLFLSLSQLRHELEMKTKQLDHLLVQHRKLENSLTHSEKALLMSNSNLEQAKETIATLLEQNADLRVLLKDLYVKKAEAEEQLEEQTEVVKELEKEILHLTSSMEKNLLSSVATIEEELTKVNGEREKLQEEISSLNDKLDMACALADQNEAVAIEARQESEASKLYAEQKEEEVRILEHSIEELESTINVLEKKVNDMGDEVERHWLIRDSLEQELQALRHRLSTVQNFSDWVDTDNAIAEQTEEQISKQLENRLLELHEAHKRIRLLEKERVNRDQEIKNCNEYISELLLHSEAQALQYQQKYKTLEVMVNETKVNLTNSATISTPFNKIEKSSTRIRGSSSPFRCIGSLVQQMNLEKDKELSAARLHIEELEALVASRQKEVCMLSTRLAAAESMTHDVIRDLLGVKLDMTNYADVIDQQQVQKLVGEAHLQTEEFIAKEQEILNLKKKIDDLMEDRESYMSEIQRKGADALAAQMTAEQLQERGQLLSAQNEMLKMDNTNLKKKVAELDEMVKTLLGPSSIQQSVRQTSRVKEGGFLRLDNTDLTKRTVQSEKLLSCVNDELALYHKFSGSRQRDRTSGYALERKYRKQHV